MSFFCLPFLKQYMFFFETILLFITDSLSKYKLMNSLEKCAWNWKRHFFKIIKVSKQKNGPDTAICITRNWCCQCGCPPLISGMSSCEESLQGGLCFIESPEDLKSNDLKFDLMICNDFEPEILIIKYLKILHVSIFEIGVSIYFHLKFETFTNLFTTQFYLKIIEIIAMQ